MADTARPIDESGVADVERLYAVQRAAYLAAPAPDAGTRIARLDALIRLLEDNEAAFVEALNADFGARAREETIVADVLMAVSAARVQKRHVRRWMRPRPVATPLHLLPGRSALLPQPRGVVGIISPWNYPVNLALSPAAAALAAGCRVILKPSELTPRTSALLKALIADAFDESVFAVVLGGPAVGEAVAKTPFDHLLFTGSTAVGRRIAESAASNLTSVTLELGGKSPAMIDDSADIATAAASIAYGKLLNAGQTCIAPDYVLVSPARREALIEALGAAARALYPQIETTADYSAIISERHFARLSAMTKQAREAGCRIVEVGDSRSLMEARKLPFTMLIDPPASVSAMQEEIFGPILPIVTVADADAAIVYVNERDRPLALYWFGENAEARDKVLTRTVAGGVTINDTLAHITQEYLPFGGVGKSGVGAYHGRAGFEAFSHLKPVFHQSRFGAGALIRPPYARRTERVIALLRRLM